MAYAAVQSLLHTIEDLEDSSGMSMGPFLYSAFHHANSLKRILDVCNEGVGDMDEQMIIIEAARRLEDAIEDSFSNLNWDIGSFVKTAKKMKEMIEGSWEKKVAKMIEDDVEEFFVQKPSKPDLEDEEEDVEMVGLRDQFLQLRDYLLIDRTGEEVLDISERVVWISGMAGIGKTLLARKIFDDPLVKRSFQYQAFVRVGKNYQSQTKLLQAVMEEVNLDEESSRGLLFLRKSLLVLDDVWYETLIFPLLPQDNSDDKGSLIMVTSRTDPLYFYHFWNVKMRFMNEEESWELLKRKVFQEEKFHCPPQLVKYGKEIAMKCEGLPLLINAVAPILLSQAQKIPECWRRISDKPNPVLEEASYHISGVLFSSYQQLISEEYKLCFLYIVAFPLSSVIRLSRIISLCSAERFNDSVYSVYSELIRFNLVIGHHKSWSSIRIKACSLHCAYWFPSKRLAENNKFLCIINNLDCVDDLDGSPRTHRRLAVHYNALMGIREVHDRISSIPTVRSLLCTGAYHPYQVPLCWEWKLLRVLHALTIRFYEFPDEVVKLVRLRYLAFTSNAGIPPSISKLEKLEFLIVHQHSSIKRAAVESYLPIEIWELHQLQHLEIMGRNILEPPRPGTILPNLTKLLGVGVESYTKGVLECLPQLEKLRIQSEMAPNATQFLSFFDHVSYTKPSINSSFQFVIMNPTLLLPPPPLSISKSSLNKLSLSGFGYPWEEMSKIAEFLPNLYVLKLQSYAFRGEKWEAKETVFKGLSYLLIDDTDLVHWTTGAETFPRLMRLTMRNCYKLREIPTGLPLLHEGIEMVDCNPRAEAYAKDNYDAKRVTVSAEYSWKKKLNS